METEPPSQILLLGSHLASIISLELMITLAILMVLILFSALISGSEVAFFSLNSSNLKTLEQEEGDAAKRILLLKKNPKKLLATILITNNFVNIAIVIVTQFVVNMVLPPDRMMSLASCISEHWIAGIMSAPNVVGAINFLLTVVLVTFILVLFGEVAPKIYANIDNLRFSRFMSRPLSVLNLMFSPMSNVLVGWGNGIEGRIAKSRNYQTGSSKEDLDAAIELAVQNEEDSQQEVDILKGIINFGDLSAKQIMKPRVDVIAIDVESDFAEVMQCIRDSGFSRIPIYEEDFDKVVGILYVKDLLGFIGKDKAFNWQDIIRKNTLFVPESKKIDDLLREFQSKRLHMAIVVNEYGGSEGIITLEDIMEEVIGDIKDEFDEEEPVNYIKIGKSNFIFEGKSLLNDVAKVIDEPSSYFDDVKGEADSLAGMIIEHLGFIPQADKELKIKEVTLKVISVTNRRIEKVNLKLKRS